MTTNRGGYTFINPTQLQRLTDAELQAMFIDKTSVLMRVLMTNGTQKQGVLEQLTAYK
jgi:hypothetical protein